MRPSNAFSIGVVVVLLLSSLAVLPAFAMAAPASADTSTSAFAPLQVGGGTVGDGGNESGGDGGGGDGDESSSEGEPSARLQSAVDYGNANAGGSSGNESGGNESGDTTATDRRAESQGVDNTERSGTGDTSLFDVASRVTAITDALVTATIEELNLILADLLDSLNWVLFRLPAPGDPYDVVSWITADNGWWPEFLMFYGAMAGGALGFLLASTMAAIAGRDTTASRETLRMNGKAAAHIITGPFTLAAFLHLFNGVNQALAVSGSEMLSTPGNAAQLGIVASLFLLLLKFYAVAIALGLIIQIGQFVLTHVAYAMWPVSWGFRAVPVPTFQALGEFGVNALPLLMLLNFGQVVILRMLFELNWSAYGWGAVIVGMLGMAVMVFLVLVYAPIMMANQQWEAVGVSIGSRQAKDAGSSAIDFAEAKIGDVRARFNDSPRGSTTSGSVQPGATSNRLSGSPSGLGSGSGGSSSSSSRSSGSSGGSASSSSSGSSEPDRTKIDRRRRDAGT